MRTIPLLALLSACARVAPEPVVHDPRVAAVDADALGKEATEVLSGYLKVDSTNPPGNESAAAQYLAAILDREGIAYTTEEVEPGRTNLYARLKGTGEEAPLCLLNHEDVVTAEADRWKEPPLSGVVKDGVIWGRGALDMKGMGVVELMTLIELHRLQIPLKRDVLFLATADEEVDGKGIDAVAKHWADFGCSHVINEGGMGLQGAVFGGQTLFPISVAEKGHLWVKMVAHGRPGHGSTPKPDEAPDRLARALQILEDRAPDVEVQDPMYAMLAAAGREHGGVSGWIVRHPWMVRKIVVPKLLKSPPAAATITNTAHLTGYGGALSPNVVPSEVYAVLDCRLLPGKTPDSMLADLKALIPDDQITWDVLSTLEANESEWRGDPVFAALAKHLVDGRAGYASAPFISIGSTDSQTLRPLVNADGQHVRAYGMIPFEVNDEELSTMHGDNERVSVDNLRDGTRRFLEFVVEVAAKTEAATTSGG